MYIQRDSERERDRERRDRERQTGTKRDNGLRSLRLSPTLSLSLYLSTYYVYIYQYMRKRASLPLCYFCFFLSMSRELKTCRIVEIDVFGQRNKSSNRQRETRTRQISNSKQPSLSWARKHVECSKHAICSKRPSQGLHEHSPTQPKAMPNSFVRAARRTKRIPRCLQDTSRGLETLPKQCLKVSWQRESRKFDF